MLDSASALPLGGAGGTWPEFGNLPYEHRIEVTPQKAAGMRKLPPKSVPIDNGTIPVATETALPPLLLPHVREKSNGFFVIPNTGLKKKVPFLDQTFEQNEILRQKRSSSNCKMY